MPMIHTLSETTLKKKIKMGGTTLLFRGEVHSGMYAADYSSRYFVVCGKQAELRSLCLSRALIFGD